MIRSALLVSGICRDEPRFPLSALFCDTPDTKKRPVPRACNDVVKLRSELHLRRLRKSCKIYRMRGKFPASRAQHPAAQRIAAPSPCSRPIHFCSSTERSASALDWLKEFGQLVLFLWAKKDPQEGERARVSGRFSGIQSMRLRTPEYPPDEKDLHG
jgi:hypothetical protein